MPGLPGKKQGEVRGLHDPGSQQPGCLPLLSQARPSWWKTASIIFTLS